MPRKPSDENRFVKGADIVVEVDDPNGRADWLISARVDANGKPVPGGLARASEARRHLEAERFLALFDGGKGNAPPPPTQPGLPGSVNWTPLGPSVVAHGQSSGNPPVSGRVNALAVGPGGLRVYAGAANGGVWRSDNAGQTWSPLDDYATSPSYSTSLNADSLSVGALAVRFGAAATNDVVFVGTGEPNPGFGVFGGIGIKYSTNGGGTFTREATNLAGAGIYRIVIDPNDSSIVFAATTSGLFRRPASAPFTTWNHVTSVFANPNAAATDLVVAGSGATKIYHVAFQSDAVYSSPNGTAWTAVTGTGGLGVRTSLAAGENDPSVVYALRDNGTMFRKDSGTAGAFQAVTGVPNALLNGQGAYDLVVAVDPSNANTAYLGGAITWDATDYALALFKGTITGSPGSYAFPFDNAANGLAPAAPIDPTMYVPNDPTWIGRGLHADAHCLAFATNAGGAHDATNVWVGCDGGVFNSTVSGTRGTFAAKNDGLAITEITYFGQRWDTDSVLVAGAQDQGSLRFRGEQVCYEAPEGDGGATAVDPNNPYNMMRQYVRLRLYRTSDGDASTLWTDLKFAGLFPPVGAGASLAQLGAVATENNNTSFYSQFGVSPSGISPTLLTFGTNRLWLTNDWGSTWVTLPTATNPYAGGGTNTAQDVLDSTKIVASVVAAASLIFVATRTGLWKLQLTAATWTSTSIVSGLPAGRIITALAVENAAAATPTLYATISTLGLEHVWYFDGSWHQTGLLATVDVPAWSIVVDPDHANTVYVGTDVGVWHGVRSGLTWAWTIYSDGLPEAAVISLAIHERTRLLRAGTHGRGMWERTLDAATNQDPDIYMRVNYADTGRIVGGGRYPWVDGAPDPAAPGYNVYHWMSADIKVRRPNLTLAALSPQQDYFDFAVNVGDYIDSATHMETADLPGTTDTFFVEVHNRGTTALPGGNVHVLLLFANASAGLPALPSGYADHIAANHTSPAWLGPNWFFADAVSPYRTLPGELSARIPQVVRYDADLSLVGLLPGQDHVCAAAFITTATDPLTSTETNLDILTMTDKHVVHRNLHLVVSTATPAAAGGYDMSPATFLIDFHNVAEQREAVTVSFHHVDRLAHLSVMIPEQAVANAKLDRFTTHGMQDVAPRHQRHFASWFGLIDKVLHLGRDDDDDDDDRAAPRLNRHLRHRWDERVGGLDRGRLLVAEQRQSDILLRDVAIPLGGRTTAAVTVQPPADAKPGDRFRFDIIQRRSDGTIAGGSTYVLAVQTRSPKPAK